MRPGLQERQRFSTLVANDSEILEIPQGLWGHKSNMEGREFHQYILHRCYLLIPRDISAYSLVWSPVYMYVIQLALEMREH